MTRPLLSTFALLIGVMPIFAEEPGLKVPPGFKVTLYADHTLANDIYAMTLDDKGRVLVTSRGWVKRLEDTDGDGKADQATVLFETKTGGMGMCWNNDTLLFCGDGELSRYVYTTPPKAKLRNDDLYIDFFSLTPDDAFFPIQSVSAENWLSWWLSRVIDSNAVGTTMKRTGRILPLSFGEHGGHAIRKGPDGCVYVIGGNDTGFNRMELDKSSPIKNPEAGCLLRFNPTFTSFQCIAQGFRNPYDFDFTPNGDIITYDSDTERDFLFPWYSPTRMYHVAHGQHHGWRLPGYMRSLARRDYYADTVDVLAPIGRGSPTGVVCYRHYQFPKHYRGGVFALDWTFGKIWFLPLKLEGGSYSTKPELFLEPAGVDGFAPTDACVAPDGSLFVCIGGRGTRGAVYRIEYVGTATEPPGKFVPPESTIGKMLTAPQPLDAWSRAKWENVVFSRKELGEAIGDESLPVEQRVRAIEILTDNYYGLFKDESIDFSMSKQWEIRARVAWSVGRVFSKHEFGYIVEHVQKVLSVLARDEHPRVRVAALDAVADILREKPTIPECGKHLAIMVQENLAHADKRVRMAAQRIVPLLQDETMKVLRNSIDDADIRTRLSLSLAEHMARLSHADRGPHKLSSISINMDLKLAGEALLSEDPALRLDALRMLMLMDGDWCLNNPPEEVYSAYAFQVPREKKNYFDAQVAEQIRALYPTGERNFDHEAARYFAMIEDDNPETIGKIVARITPKSSATDDIHHLIVLSRLKGKPTNEQTRLVVDALLGIEKKLGGQQRRVKQSWGPRFVEIVFNLRMHYPKMSEAMLAHSNLVNASHVAFVASFGLEDKIKAARLFLAVAQKDADFNWTPEFVDLVAQLPQAVYRPIFRKQWSDYSLRDAMLRHLLEQPDEEDRSRFLDGLDSSQRGVVLNCIEALQKLPRDPSAKNFVPILRRLRLSVKEPREDELCAKLLALLERQSGRTFNLREHFLDDLVKIRRALIYDSVVFAWFESKYPNEAKLLRGDDENAEQWKSVLAGVKWEKGDAERGAKLYRERSCMTCHTGASRIGPDLLGAAGRFSRDDLFAAIVYPSRDVAPAYRVNDIETLIGKNYSGLVVFESADGLIVQLDANNTVRIDSADIASRQPGRKSLMPTGLLKDLKPEELADLYAYLRALK